MHSEDQYKAANKGKKQRTASQFATLYRMGGALENSFVLALKHNSVQCVASTQSQNHLPTMWAEGLERENSGFSV
jgi:hypothetical protein